MLDKMILRPSPRSHLVHLSRDEIAPLIATHRKPRIHVGIREGIDDPGGHAIHDVIGQVVRPHGAEDTKHDDLVRHGVLNDVPLVRCRMIDSNIDHAVAYLRRPVVGRYGIEDVPVGRLDECQLFVRTRRESRYEIDVVDAVAEYVVRKSRTSGVIVLTIVDYDPHDEHRPLPRLEIAPSSGGSPSEVSTTAE